MFMKVSELLEKLQKLDPESEISVLYPVSHRPIGGTLEPIFEIKSYINQDSNKYHYVIDTGVGEGARYNASRRNL